MSERLQKLGLIGQSSLKQRPKGLTLVELVVTIVLMGILAGGTVAFVVSSTQSYVDTATRNQLSSIGRLTTTQLELAIKNAVPNSIRVSSDGKCIEFLPIAAVSVFTDAPLLGASAASSSSMTVVSMAGITDADYAVIYPIDDDDLFGGGTSSAIASIQSVSGGEITFTGAHTFPGRGPTNRVYFAKGPESFCLVDSNDRIYRYRSGTYNKQLSQPSPSDVPAVLPSSSPSRAVISSMVEQFSSTDPFQYVGAGLRNSGLVRVTLNFTDGDESMLVEHEILNNHAP